VNENAWVHLDRHLRPEWSPKQTEDQLGFQGEGKISNRKIWQLVLREKDVEGVFNQISLVKSDGINAFVLMTVMATCQIENGLMNNLTKLVKGQEWATR